MGDLDGHRCNSEMNLKFDEEFHKIASNENTNKYGCTVPFHPSISFTKEGENSKICENETLGILAFNYYDALRSSSWSPELTPCARFDIFIGLPDIDDTDNKNEEATIKLYMNTDIKVKSIVLYYDSTTLVAQIGGCVGMLLGISIVDVVKTFNSIFNHIVHKICK